MAKIEKKQIREALKRVRVAVEPDFRRHAVNVYLRISDMTRWDHHQNYVEQNAVALASLQLRAAALENGEHLDEYTHAAGWAWPESRCLGPIGSYTPERIVTRELCEGDDLNRAVAEISARARAHFGDKRVATAWDNASGGSVAHV